jgi:hypothetical protein
MYNTCIVTQTEQKMIKFGTTLNTSGVGYWSNKAKAVKCVGINVNYISEDKDFGELTVGFDLSTWDVNKDGLIYTDPQFIKELRQALNEAGLAGADVSYSEQGMQGEDYVSLDVGKEFLDSFKEIAPELYASAYHKSNG